MALTAVCTTLCYLAEDLNLALITGAYNNYNRNVGKLRPTNVLLFPLLFYSGNVRCSVPRLGFLRLIVRAFLVSER